jgi:hypothetical protein
MELGTSGLAVKDSDDWTTEAVALVINLWKQWGSGLRIFGKRFLET